MSQQALKFCLCCLCLLSFINMASAAKMMTQEERAAFFGAGAGLISPLGQIIREYQPAVSF